MEDKVVKLFAIAIGIAGFYLLFKFANWQTAVGVFAVVWSHNIEKHQNG